MTKTLTGPRERVTAIVIDNGNIAYYKHATYPPENQGRRAALVSNPHYDGLTKQKDRKGRRTRILKKLLGILM